VTIQLTLHGQPIKNSPVTVQVGDKAPMKIRQESNHVETISDTRPAGHDQQDAYDANADDYGNDYDQFGGSYGGGGGGGGVGVGGGGGYQQRSQTRDSADVSNEDLNRLLDELGG